MLKLSASGHLMSFRVHDIATAFVARIIAMIGPFAVSVITARVLGPEDRGRYFLVLAFAQIGAQIGNLGLQASNTYLVATRRELMGPIIANSLFVSFVVAPPAALLIGLVFGWPQLLGLESILGASLGPIALAAVPLAPLLVASLYMTNIAIGVGRVPLFNGMTIAYGFASVAIASMVAAVGGNVPLFLFGAAVSLALPTFFGTVRLLGGDPMPMRFDAELFRRGIGFAVKVYLATMFGFIMTRVGALALQHRASLDEVGQFSVAMQLSDGLVMLPSTVGILLFPELLRTKNSERWQSMWRTFWIVAAIMLAIAVVVWILAPWLIAFLFGPAFAKAATLMRMLLPSVFFISLMSVVSQYLAAEGFPRIQVFAWLIGLTMQTALSYWTAGIWGGIGVSLSFAASNLVVLLILLAEIFRRRLGSR